MLEVQGTQTVHKIWDKERDDYPDGYVYEWAEGSNYVNVWPKGSFNYKPEDGSIWLDQIIDGFDPETFTVDMLIKFLAEEHEPRVRRLTEDDDVWDYYCEPEVYG